VGKAKRAHAAICAGKHTRGPSGRLRPSSTGYGEVAPLPTLELARHRIRGTRSSDALVALFTCQTAYSTHRRISRRLNLRHSHRHVCRSRQALMLRSRAFSAFTRVHSPSKTGVNALEDALWRGVSKYELAGASAAHRPSCPPSPVAPRAWRLRCSAAVAPQEAGASPPPSPGPRCAANPRRGARRLADRAAPPRAPDRCAPTCRYAAARTRPGPSTARPASGGFFARGRGAARGWRP
jgi:hypothetical protein